MLIPNGHHMWMMKLTLIYFEITASESRLVSTATEQTAAR